MGGMIAQHFDEDDSYSFSGDHAMGLGFGVGLDLGIQYQFHKNFKVTGSAKNIGGAINWREQFGRKLTMAGDGQISFDGIEANLNTEDLQQNIKDQFQSLEDELKSDFKLNRVTEGYKTQIGNAYLISGHFLSNNRKHELLSLIHI